MILWPEKKIWDLHLRSGCGLDLELSTLGKAHDLSEKRGNYLCIYSVHGNL